MGPSACGRLAAAIPGSEVWITQAPSADHPLRVSQGRWGMHTQSYKLYPEMYVERVTRFFDARFIGPRDAGGREHGP